MVEDEKTVYIIGDRTISLTWNDQACMIIWLNLDSSGIIHSL